MAENPDTLGDLLGRYLSEQATVIVGAESDLRAGENVIHLTRVAVRRLRSTLRVYADLFDVAQAGQLEDELVWWAGLLGEVRDLDILADRLATMLDALPAELVLGPVQRTIETELALRRKAALDAVVAALDTDRYRRLMGLLDRWRSGPPLTARAQRPAAKVKSYVKAANNKVEKRLATAVSTHREGGPAVEAFHRARKAGKRHRYAVEAAAPVVGPKADQVIDRRKDLQDLLGDHHDSFVSAAFLRDLGGRLGARSGQNGFTYGLLYAREQAVDDRLLADLEPFL
jgi:CHAD domain-containing protein